MPFQQEKHTKSVAPIVMNLSHEPWSEDLTKRCV